MIRLAILDDYQHASLKLADWSALQTRCEIEIIDRNLAVPDEAAERLQPFDILCTMRERMAFPRRLFERLPKLKLVGITGAHHRTLDLDAATEHGVAVAHTSRSGGEHATSELAWGLILASLRHIAFEDRMTRQGAWQTTMGTLLHRKTLGIVGLGRLGGQMAVVGKAFGMEILAWSPNLTDERAAQYGARRVEKDELFRASDVVTLHVVLSDRSRGMVGARELGLMKPTALLVNTSRGPLVDRTALFDTLRNRRIAGAAIDVYDEEPLPADDPIRQFDNVVMTPHLGYVAEETMRAFYLDTVENVAGFLDGKPVRVLNPEALKKR